MVFLVAHTCKKNMITEMYIQLPANPSLQKQIGQ